jgi:dUTP pyrophosphatase
MTTFKFYKLPHAKHLPLPYKATEGSAGYDVHASMIGAGEEGYALKSGWIIKVSTGLCADIPKGWEIQIRPRSGLSSKHGVTVLNAPATIDSDYTGEICVLLINHGSKDFIIRDGDRIAQFVFAPVYSVNVESVDVIEKRTHRGDNGFGSTGVSGMRRKKLTEKEIETAYKEMEQAFNEEVRGACPIR